MAPELVNAIGSDGFAVRTKYSGKPVDVWACGVLLYALSCRGKFPFR
jgi:serine/threonine protein kinase